MKRPPRAVLDTNAVLSALVFAHGPAARLREAWQTGRCEPLVSKATADELIRVLAYPRFKLSAHEQHELLADYLPHCKAVTIPAKKPRTPSCRDPFDVPFLQLAIVGGADYLVTGDQDLLEIKSKLLCPIVPLEAVPRRFARYRGVVSVWNPAPARIPYSRGTHSRYLWPCPVTTVTAFHPDVPRVGFVRAAIP